MTAVGLHDTIGHVSPQLGVTPFEEFETVCSSIGVSSLTLVLIKIGYSFASEKRSVL